METLIDDKEFLIPFFSEVCSICIHLISVENKRCKAYPKGIPLKIWNEDTSHLKKHKDQKRDFVFEKIEGIK